MADELAAAADGFRPVSRDHVADRAFVQLVTAILRGERAPGSNLPPERVLAEQFGVSRIIVRQAIHRLAELRLVRVRQGGATVVLDPEASGDPRVVELYYRYVAETTEGSRDLVDLTERQAQGALGLVSVAARRARRDDLVALASIVEAWAQSDDPERDFLDFEETFWTAMARAGGNRIYVLETAYWFRVLRDRPEIQHRRLAPVPMRIALYRELVRRLVENDDAPGFYFDVSSRYLAAFTSSGGTVR